MFGWGGIGLAYLAYFAFFVLNLTWCAFIAYDWLLEKIVRWREPNGRALELEMKESPANLIVDHPWKKKYATKGRRLLAVGVIAIIPLVISGGMFYCVNKYLGVSPSFLTRQAQNSIDDAVKRSNQHHLSPGGPFIPSRAPSGADGTYNCSDFASQADAQAYFDSVGDVDGLDGDGNGFVCENLP